MNLFRDFLKTAFPCKVQKISVNAGFTCPNRDGAKGFGGCTYCNNRTFSPQYAAAQKSVSRQLQEGVRFFARKYPHMKYLAYFQSYTNTYGAPDELLSKYHEALNFPDVAGLIIATRPDCMTDELLAELQKISRNRFLLLEYGVESTSNDTLKLINRGHTYEEAAETIRRTHEHGVRCGAHLILGLPGESRDTMLAHADNLSTLPITTLKLHQLQLIKHTGMAAQMAKNPELFHLFTVDEYIDLCIDFLKRLNPSIYVDRFISQSPEQMLAVPGWGLKNHEFMTKLRKACSEKLG
jgi:radical SAM protein (TIGR01212 family)